MKRITKNLAEDIDVDEIKSKLKDLIDNAVKEKYGAIPDAEISRLQLI